MTEIRKTSAVCFPCPELQANRIGTQSGDMAPLRRCEILWETEHIRRSNMNKEDCLWKTHHLDCRRDLKKGI